MVFEAFRRRQKVFLTFLAIMAMIAFILGSFLYTLAPDARTDRRVLTEAWGEPIRVDQLQGLANDRIQAGQFLFRAIAQAKVDPQLHDFRGFPTDQPSLILGLVLAEKAERLGIQVTDDEVQKWMDSLTNNKLTRDDYVGILSGKINPFPNEEEGKAIGMSDERLFSVLRRELAISQALQSSLPPTMATFDTPIDFWEAEIPQLTEVTLEFVEVPVAKFVDGAAEPTEQQLRETYNKYSVIEADSANETVGLMVPRRVAAQYLEAKTDDMLASIEVSDEEIAKYYEEHRLEFTETPEPTLEEGPSPAPPAPPEEPKPEGTPAPAEGTEKPADAPKPPETPTPTSPEPPPAPAEKKEEPPAPATPSPPASGESPPPGNASRQVLESGSLIAASAQEGEQPAPPAPAQPDPAPPAPAQPEPAKDAPLEEKKPEPTPAETPPAPESPAPPPANAAAQPEPPGAAPAPPAQEPKVKPLEAVKEEIRKRIQQERAGKILQDKMQTLIDKQLAPYLIKKYRPARSSYATAHRQTDGTVDWSEFKAPEGPDLQKIADENHWQLKNTGLLSATEIEKLPGLASATRIDRLAGTPQDFRQVLFGVGVGEDLYAPRMLSDESSNTYYTFWKVEDEAPHAPPLESVKDQVVALWRQDVAKEKAKASAEEMAKKARESEGKLSATIAEGSETKVQTTEPFPRVRVLPTGIAGNESIPIPVQISNIKGAKDAFLDEVFKLKEGEIAAIPDASTENYYVVKVASRKEPEFDRFATDYRRSIRGLRWQTQSGGPYGTMFSLSRQLTPQLFREAGVDPATVFPQEQAPPENSEPPPVDESM